HSPRTSTLFPYTTLFRSNGSLGRVRVHWAGVRVFCTAYVPPGRTDNRGQDGGRLSHRHRRQTRPLERPPGQSRGVKFLGELVPRSEEHTSELQSPYDLVC